MRLGKLVIQKKSARIMCLLCNKYTSTEKIKMKIFVFLLTVSKVIVDILKDLIMNKEQHTFEIVQMSTLYFEYF